MVFTYSIVVIVFLAYFIMINTRIYPNANSNYRNINSNTNSVACVCNKLNKINLSVVTLPLCLIGFQLSDL